MEEYPKIQKGDGSLSDEVTTHPAYAQIRASRVNGHASLYGSDFDHQHYITVSISGSECHRHLNRDWHFARAEMISIAMSEAQWATFVSSMNIGGGVPCTLEHVNRAQVPGIKRHEAKNEKFSRELVEKLQSQISELSCALAEIEDIELKVSNKVRDRFSSAIKRSKSVLTSTIPFIAKQFDEHTESTVEKAKIEINAYMTNAVQRAGLEAISSGAPLAIEVKKEAKP